MARRLHKTTAMASRTRARAGARGFTLVELAVVVVIVGVLAVLAVVGYRKMVLSSKMTEATNMVGAYRIAQEDYKAERGTYFAGSSTTWCPAAGGTGNKKTMWNPACTGGLPVHADGAVYFSYRTAGGSSWSADLLGLGWVDWTGMPAGRPFYQVHAICDLDGDGATPSTEVVGTSATGDIFHRNDGY